VQLKLTLTPLLKKRQVRPELWSVTLQTPQGPLLYQLDIPGQYYEFEPLPLSDDAIVQFQDPRGMPLYSQRHGGQQIGHLQEVIRFYEIHNDAILIATGGKKGWLRARPLAARESEAISFAKGLVRLLRGDWRGARQSFNRVLEHPALPQELRIHSLIYRGLAKEKGGHSGRADFSAAYRLNRLDRTAAAYLLMSQVDELADLQRRSESSSWHDSLEELKRTVAATRMLFDKQDQWFRQIARLVE
jgi:hypothetical protein